MSELDTTASGYTRSGSILRRMARRIFRRPATSDSALDDIAFLEASGRFDKTWYLAQYPDVAQSGMDPIEHYVRHGAAEGRDPSEQFNTLHYLRCNPDVSMRDVNPFRHYLEHGLTQGRTAIPSSIRKIVGGPLVSIVIPVYAVEQYLAECLDSVIRQTYCNLEIIIVDDGSPDRSFDIAEAYAQSDARIRILRRENGGLGAARNTGIVAATGRYLTFVDSDDRLPVDAIAKMVKALQTTDSDFVVGAMSRLRAGNKITVDGWVKDVHAEDRFGLRLENFPKILTDVFACNKLFDINFFRNHIGAFPERIRYEDQEPTAKAYLAGKFDVLAATVYFWRVRDDGSSITQAKSDPEDLRDRLIVKQRVARVLAGAHGAVYGTWLAKALGFDLRPYFEQIPRTNVEFFEQLRDGMLPLAAKMTPELWRKVRMVDRLPALAVLAGLRADVRTALTLRGEYGYFVPGRIKDGAAYLDTDYLNDMSLSPDDELLRLGEADLQVVARATRFWWNGTRLHLEGYAYITNLEFDNGMSINARLAADNCSPVELNVHQRECPRVDMESGDAWNSYARSGFAIELDPVELDLASCERWHIEISVCHDEINTSHRARLLDIDARGITGTPPLSALCGPIRWIAGFEPSFGFALRCVESPGVRVSAIHVEGESVAIRIDGPTTGDALLLACESLQRRIEVTGAIDDSGSAAYRFDLPPLPDGTNGEHLWDIWQTGEGVPRKLSYAGDLSDLEKESPEYRRVRADTTGEGVVRLVQSRWWAVVDEVEVGPCEIIVRGRIDAPGATDLGARLGGDTQQLVADFAELDVAAEKYQARIPFDSRATQKLDDTPKDTLQSSAIRGTSPAPEQPKEPLPPTMLHGFSFRVSVEIEGIRSECWVKVATFLQREFPLDRNASRYGLTFTRTPKASALWVRFRPPYRNEERGRYAQRRLHSIFAPPQLRGSQTTPELENAILFESFAGKQISDSVLAICNEIRRRHLPLELYWTVADMGMPVPEGTTPLLIHSQAWMHKLRHVRYLVNNNNFPFYFRKNPGQIYLQTWHGTPLKKIGDDVPQSSLSLVYRSLMRREATYWDFLLAQNDFAAKVLPRAFNYDGPVLNLGYPRNDDLIDDRADYRRLAVRTKFGFQPFHFVVLYAPTWRDNASGSRGYSRVSYLDFKRVHRLLGDNAKLVLRGHHNTSMGPAIRQSGIIDATHHTNVNDLLLAADLLITDYSSIMFDYAVTGKPIVFLTPDLEQYRDRTRGFYLDLEEIAPGPVCHDNGELADILMNLGEVIELHLEKYRDFTQRFAPRDDGGAAGRVTDTIWGSTATPDKTALYLKSQ